MSSVEFLILSDFNALLEHRGGRYVVEQVLDVPSWDNREIISAIEGESLLAHARHNTTRLLSYWLFRLEGPWLGRRGRSREGGEKREYGCHKLLACRNCIIESYSTGFASCCGTIRLPSTFLLLLLLEIHIEINSIEQK